MEINPNNYKMFFGPLVILQSKLYPRHCCCFEVNKCIGITVMKLTDVMYNIL